MGRCLDSGEKDSLLRFIKERYRERFFDPIAELMDSPGQLHGFGFAIMALCSLLIESLQCYRYGIPTTHVGEYKDLSRTFNPPMEYDIPQAERKNARQAFADFFSLETHRTLFPNVDGIVFYNAIRNGLLHQAQTKQGWRIRSGQSRLWNETDKIVDRTKFATALQESFESYVKELGTACWDDDIWLKARRKIWWLIQLSS